MAETLAPGGSSRTMQAIAVVPGKANSIHLRNDARRPAVADFPEGRGVLVEVIRVGVDGTDREIAYAEFGEAPEGDDHLIIGHESLGRIVEAGSDVPAWATPGSLVVATVRRPGSSIYDAIGFPDFTTDDVVYERGIRRLHGFLAEWYAEDVTFLVPIPESLEPVAVLMEPFSVVEKGIRQAFEIQRRLHVWQPRRAAVLGAGSIGMLAALALRLRGLDVAVYSRRDPPYLNSELLARIGARYVGSGQATLEQLAEQHGPFDLALEATGFSPLAIEAGTILARNGVLVLTGVTGGDHRADIPTDRLNQGFVLGNKVMVGTVNAARDDFVTGVADMLRAEATYPGWLGRLLTTPIKGLAGYQEMLDRLEHDEEAIKVFVEVARYRRSGG